VIGRSANAKAFLEKFVEANERENISFLGQSKKF
jgi:hypothetical protein